MGSFELVGPKHYEISLKFQYRWSIAGRWFIVTLLWVWIGWEQWRICIGILCSGLT